MATSDAFYLEIVDDVVTVINELGTTYTIRTRGAYDSNTMTVPDGASRVVSGIIANQDSFLSTSSGSSITKGEEVNMGWIGKKMLILTPDANPEDNEEILVDGQWFLLNKVQTIKPADIILLYLLDVTR